jgi:hypothetical protein
MFDSVAQFGRIVPVRPQMWCELTPTGGLREHYPQRCPRGHAIGAGTMWVGWNAGLRLRQLTCRACHEQDPNISTWCILDPGYHQRSPTQAADIGFEIVAVRPEHHLAGVGRLEIRLQGQTAADLDLALCAPCQSGIIEHIRVDPPHRRRSFGRTLVAAALTRGPDFRWSTIEIEDIDLARSFWQAVASPTMRVGHPERCPDMAAASALLE